MRVTSALNIEGRELDFVVMLCFGNAPTHAAKLSGWAVGSAARLMAKPEILAAILSIGQNCDATIARIRSRKKLTDADLDTPKLQVVARPREPVEAY